LPTYEYRCLSCEHQFERFQRMSDDPVKECELCGAAVKRLLFPVAVHFKGSGFYSTDYARRNAMGSSGQSAANGNDGEKPASADGASVSDGGKSSSKETSASSDSAKPTPAAATAKND
jgi:putative FmdB family regulatory protein